MQGIAILESRIEIHGSCIVPVIILLLVRTPPWIQPRMDYVLDAHGYQPLLNLNFMPYINVAGSLNSYFAERPLQLSKAKGCYDSCCSTYDRIPCVNVAVS